ncbi:MAG: permease [Actinomycetota bacterium]|nr:permease [Actinomycetota bacterium]
MSVLSTIGNSLSEGFFMFWETLWALVVGFTLSGAVQSFVSREQMHRALGDHRPRTILRSSLLGAASSSCSYAASALAKSLFQRGADFTSSMVFMFASTNLVIELGIVLWLLIGWQFALAEFVGGAIMIVLFTLLAPRIFPAKELQAARDRLAAVTGAHADHGASGSAAEQGKPLRQRLRSRAGWADAASYTVADLTMLRRELFIGYLVAGFLAVAVPASAYSAVFLSGHGIWTDIENVIVGPFIAFISFVCSIGNVPLAAALYKGGISFGGTVAFIFADLIALPLVVIYGKFYGKRLALRLFLSFWLVMSTAGLAVDLLFRAVGIQFPARPAQIAPTRFEWNYTTVLNIVFLVVAGVVYWTYRNRERLGGGGQYAIDPICGMQVERGNAPATSQFEGATYYFCSDRCHDKFTRDPAKHAGHPSAEPMEADGPAGGLVDPVCGMTVDPAAPGARSTREGRDYLFCSPGCKHSFDADPLRYAPGTADPARG